MAMSRGPSPRTNPQGLHKVKANSAGRGESAKTRPDVPSTQANKAGSGKQVGSNGGSGGRGRGKG